MVIIRLPTAAATGVRQERVAAPSTWTVQAPQSPMPQAYFVPVMPIAKHPQQGHLRIGIHDLLAAVNLERESFHTRLLNQGSTIDWKCASHMQESELKVWPMQATVQPIE